MFGKLRQMMGKSLTSALELQALRDCLGDQYATDLQNFSEGKYKGNESLSKRATGLSYLGKAILSSKKAFDDSDRHIYFWQEIIRPTVDIRYSKTYTGEYDPKRFYVDAVDFSAVISLLPGAIAGGETPISLRMSDILKSLNAREANAGGYFGNTPYWTLYDNQIWRMIDREFTSVQMYWFALMLADETASSLSTDITRAIATEQRDFLRSPKDSERNKFFTKDLLKIAQYISLGALSFTSLKDLSNTRLKALYQLLNSVAPSANLAFEAVLTESANNGVEALKVVLPDENPLHNLPTQSFVLSLHLKAAFSKLVPLVGITETMAKMPKSENLINNPRETTPHLLHASM